MSCFMCSIPIGSTVDLSQCTGYCAYCNHTRPLNQLAVYLGFFLHPVKGYPAHHFQFTPPWHCPGCGGSVSYCTIDCPDGGVVIELPVAIEEEV